MSIVESPEEMFKFSLNVGVVTDPRDKEKKKSHGPIIFDSSNQTSGETLAERMEADLSRDKAINNTASTGSEDRALTSK